MFVREYLSLLTRRPLLHTIIGALVFAAVMAQGLITQPTYGATTSLLFAATGGNSATELNQAATYLQREMASYVRVATSPNVLNPVIQQLHLTGETPATLAKSINVTNPTMTVILDITVTRENPTEAASIANTLTRQLAATVQKTAPTQSDGHRTQQTISASPLAEAQTPEKPTGLTWPLRAAIAIAAALITAFITAILFGGLDQRIRVTNDLRRIPHTRLLSTIPHRSLRSLLRRTPQPATPETTNPTYERTAGLLIGEHSTNHAPITLITSPNPTTNTYSTALALAQAAHRIGATAAIIDTTSLPPATITTLITGNSDNTPEITITTLTTTGETQTTTPANLTELANNYELILLATPPHPASAHSQLLTATANTTLLVVPLTTHKN
ncbi:YveK family protein, partial [Dermatophilus congolensis]